MRLRASIRRIADKQGVREINVLQGREGRRDTWARIRRREQLDEWDHLQFEVIALDKDGAPAPSARSRRRGRCALRARAHAN